ncbi:MAG: ATP-binding protein [Candidatus Bathyarchaeia archaeon]
MASLKTEILYERIKEFFPVIISILLTFTAIFRHNQTRIRSYWLLTLAGAMILLYMALMLVADPLKILRGVWFKLRVRGDADLLNILGIGSIDLVNGNTIAVHTRSTSYYFAIIRLLGRPHTPEAGVGSMASLSQYQNLFLRLRDFISGLQKCGLPVTYSVCLQPISFGMAHDDLRSERGKAPLSKVGEEKDNELKVDEKPGFLKTDVILSTSIAVEDPFSLDKLETNVRSIQASISTAFPGMEAKRLEGAELVDVLNSFRTGEIDHGAALVVPEVASLLPAIVPTPSSLGEPMEPAFDLPDPEKVLGYGPFLGWVAAYGRKLYRINLDVHNFPAHIAIFGMTGSGKSTTAGTIVTRALEFGMKTLIFDWHNEYRSPILSRGGLVFTPGRNISPLTINPFDSSFTEDLNEHISLVTDIFADVFNFTEPQSFMFMEATTLAYKHVHAPSQPTISTILSEIRKMPISSKYDHETKLALNRRLKPLTKGQAGKALNGPSTIDLGTLLEKLVSIELGHFKEQRIRKIFVSILLKLIYDHRTTRPSSCNHITLIEEARNLIPPRRPDDPLSIGERIISELRKFGECIITVTQFPSQISSEVLKNAATRISHRMKVEEDQRILQGAMRLSDSQSAFLHYLKPGYALADFPSINSSFLIYVDSACDLQVNSISDNDLAKKMRSARLT